MSIKTIIEKCQRCLEKIALCIVLLITILLQNSLAKSTVHEFIARDDGASNASFASFRKHILQSIDNRNKTEIEQTLSPNITATIGGAAGIEAFEKLWQGLCQESPFWSTAKKILEHGAQFDRESNQFHAPAVTFEDNHSDFPQAIVWSKNAFIYSRPNIATPAKKSAYNEQISILEPKEHKPLSVKWLKVRTKGGDVGYMKADDLYSSFDTFAVFKKENGKWQLSWFGYAEL